MHLGAERLNRIGDSPKPNRSVNSFNPALIRFSFAWLRRKVRASEAMFILLAVGVGGASALLSVVQGGIARTLQHVLFALPPATRLSETPALAGWALLVLPAGGAILALFSLAVRVRKRRLVDPVEANALHGGRMSIADSLVISGQTVLSNGFGASVGLEAAYTQLGGAIAAWIGSALALRRADLRHLVGAGAGAAIGAVFGAPLAGAFYAFEIVIGAYTPSAIAPVAAAALAGALVAQTLDVPVALAQEGSVLRAAIALFSRHADIDILA